jgi:hypothetical protein
MFSDLDKRKFCLGWILPFLNSTSRSGSLILVPFSNRRLGGSHFLCVFPLASKGLPTLLIEASLDAAL